MASLTPLSKGLIALAVVGAVVSVVWNLGLKERFGGTAASSGQTAPGVPTKQQTPVALVAAKPAPTEPQPVAAPPAVHAAPAPAPKPAPASGRTAAENAEAGRKFLDNGNFTQARIHLEQAVQGGDGAAACHLGDMTLKGQGGIVANQEKAASLYRLAQSRNVICFAPGS